MKMFFFLSLLALGACQIKQDSTKTETTKNDVLTNNKDSTSTKAKPTASISDKAINEIDYEEDLFGDFFNDRASFYIQENPDESVQKATVYEKTLYFLDGDLCKTKYILSENIANSLINKYGRFKIKHLDSINQVLIHKEKIISQIKDYWHLNPKLNCVQLTWELPDKHIILKVNEKDSLAPYRYFEQIVDYKARLYNIQRGGT